MKVKEFREKYDGIFAKISDFMARHKNAYTDEDCSAVVDELTGFSCRCQLESDLMVAVFMELDRVIRLKNETGSSPEVDYRFMFKEIYNFALRCYQYDLSHPATRERLRIDFETQKSRSAFEKKMADAVYKEIIERQSAAA